MYLEIARDKGISIDKVKPVVDKPLSKKAKEITSKKRKPIMEIEIRIDEKVMERCLVYEGDTAESLTKTMTKKYKLTEQEAKSMLEQLSQEF